MFYYCGLQIQTLEENPASAVGIKSIFVLFSSIVIKHTWMMEEFTWKEFRPLHFNLIYYIKNFAQNECVQGQ